MKLSELFENVPDIEIRGLMADSRTKRPDSIFFCVKGMMSDGHRFVDQAIENGAKVIVHSETLENKKEGIVYIRVNNVIRAFNQVADAFYGYPSHELYMYGITGTNGKSSTACIIRDILNPTKKTGYVGTISIEYGDVKLPPLLTTPNIDDLHGILHEIKWNTISNTHIEMYKELIDCFFDSEMEFRCILVKYKDRLDNQSFNNGEHDNFYYKMIYYLLVNPYTNPRESVDYRVFLDIKDTKGRAKLNKIHEIFKNKFHGKSPFISFQHIRSHESQFIQLADFFIGAVTYKATIG